MRDIGTWTCKFRIPGFALSFSSAQSTSALPEMRDAAHFSSVSVRRIEKFL